MSIVRIDPASFIGPRAYITIFDPKIVQYKRNKEKFQKEVERKLKMILLTKNTVVCAASHLADEFSYTIFQENPILIEKHMIIPALRRDVESVAQYIDERCANKDLRHGMLRLYERSIDSVVDWELIENMAWFKKNLLRALGDKNSVIRRNLTPVSVSSLKRLVQNLRAEDVLSREIIIDAIRRWPRKAQRTLLNFVNLLYHMSGARVVNCESTLPQEDYIDYRLADFSRTRTTISEMQIFCKIFFELAFESLHSIALPVELLDFLSFEDIYHIRRPIEDSVFRAKYESLVILCMKSTELTATKVQNVISYIEDPLPLLEEITQVFKDVFDHELLVFLKKKHKESSRELRKSGTSVGIGAASLVPVPILSQIVSAIGLSISSRELLVNLLQHFKSRKAVNDYNLYLMRKKELLYKKIDKFQISNESTFLDTIDLLVQSVVSKLLL